jgi:hypothetical protein
MEDLGIKHIDIVSDGLLDEVGRWMKWEERLLVTGK